MAQKVQVKEYFTVNFVENFSSEFFPNHDIHK